MTILISIQKYDIGNLNFTKLSFVYGLNSFVQHLGKKFLGFISESEPKPLDFRQAIP
jgi:hypothetical protein